VTTLAKSEVDPKSSMPNRVDPDHLSRNLLVHPPCAADFPVEVAEKFDFRPLRAKNKKIK
jgi:hypothetical protein